MSPRDLPAAPCLAAALAALSAIAQPATTQSLFAGHAPVRLTLETDLRALMRDRGQDRQEHPARLQYVDSAGLRVSLDIEVRTRGNFRLRRTVCSFPPLRLDFPRAATAGTLFAGQDKLKLVTHCQGRRSYEQSVLHEYLMYRILNLLTDKSFRARLARVTYLDTAGREDSVTRYAVLLESDEELAQRQRAQIIEQRGVAQELTDFDHMGIVAVFQYLVGNTDWSVAGLHNIVVLQDTLGVAYAVPYDFDWAGVISAPYAVPDPRIGTKTVRERVYRGYCRTEEQFGRLFAAFNAQKDAIYALYRAQEGLDRGELERTLNYFDEFYRIINDPGRARREFSQNCQGA